MKFALLYFCQLILQHLVLSNYHLKWVRNSHRLYMVGLDRCSVVVKCTCNTYKMDQAMLNNI